MNTDDLKARRRNRHRRRRLRAIRKNRLEPTPRQRDQMLVIEHPGGTKKELTYAEMMARKARMIGRSLDQGMRHDIETSPEVLLGDDDGLAFA